MTTLDQMLYEDKMKAVDAYRQSFMGETVASANDCALMRWCERCRAWVNDDLEHQVHVCEKRL